VNPRCKAGLLVLLLAPLAARSEQWTLDHTVATRYEVNDNAALAPTSPGTMNSLSLSSNLQAARRSENAATSVRALMAAVEERGRGANDRVDGQWRVSQTFDDPLHSLSLSAGYLQDLNSNIDTGDVLVGRARRRTTQADASLSRQLSPRWSASVQGAFDRTRYGADGASDFRNGSGGGGLSYRLTERQTASLHLSQARYRTEDGRYRSTTDQFSLGWSQQLSERSSMSLSLGGYRSRSEGQRTVLVCPLDPSFCPTFIPYQRVTEPANETRRGLQFNFSSRWQLGEAIEASLRAAREQSPSGAGVLARRDTLGATLNLSFTPRASGSFGYARSRALYGSFGGDVSRTEESLSLSFTHRLAEDLSLQAGATHRRARSSLFGGSASANAVNLSLSVDWPRLDASR
jgi:hypothetical protein